MSLLCSNPSKHYFGVKAKILPLNYNTLHSLASHFPSLLNFLSLPLAYTTPSTFIYLLLLKYRGNTPVIGSSLPYVVSSAWDDLSFDIYPANSFTSFIALFKGHLNDLYL